MRRDYDKFLERDVAILVTGPEDATRFKNYFEKHRLPFSGLPDPQHEVLRRYGQEIKIFKFGRMPAQILIDRHGFARYVHYGNSMSDIPTNDELLALVDSFDQSEDHSDAP